MATALNAPSTLEVGRGAVLLLEGELDPPRGLRGFVVELDDERQHFPTRSRTRAIFLPVAVEGRRAATRARLRVMARHRGGETVLVDQPIAFIEHARRPERIDTPIAICLATYNPDPTLLARQLESIRAQTRRDWTCIIHDDGSRLERWAAIEELARSDERFRVFRAERNRGFYRNFEAALALVPPSTPYVALADQDDVWHPDKLAACIARLDGNPRAQLVYSDLRVVDAAGAVLRPTFWSRRRNNYTALETLLFVNTVTGAASLFRGALLETALPFPPAVGRVFHDHWLACAAMVAGGLEYIDRPLLDYVQHGGNVIGHDEFAPLSAAGILARHARNVAEMVARPSKLAANVATMRAIFADDYRRLQVLAATLRLRHPDASAEQRRALALFDGTLAQALRLVGPAHVAVWRRGDTTDLFEFRLGMSVLVDRLFGGRHVDSPRGPLERFRARS